jgi:hypothetical protein
MARPRGIKNRKKHVFQDPTIEEVVEMEIEVKDPVTGKMIKQKVKVKKLKPIRVESQHFIGPKDDIEEIDEDDGLSLYGEPDEAE